VLQLLQKHGKDFQEGREQQRLQQQQQLAATTDAQTFLMGLRANAMLQQLHPQGNGLASGVFSLQQPRVNLLNPLLQLPAASAPAASYTSHTTHPNHGYSGTTSNASSGSAIAGTTSNLLLSLLLGVNGSIQLPTGSTGAVPAGSVMPRGGAPAPIVAATMTSGPSVQLDTTEVASPLEGTALLPTEALQQVLTLLNQYARQRGAS
jgi:hypothetical protein